MLDGCEAPIPHWVVKEGNIMGVMSVIIGLVIGVIGLVIVNSTISSANFTSGTLLDTVTSNIPILFAVGLLVLAVSWAALR